MDDFRTRVRAALAARRMSLRGAARALSYDVAYLSRVLNGKQSPSLRLAEGLDELLGTNGELIALVARPDHSEKMQTPGGLPVLNGEKGESFARTIREMSSRLIVMDNQMNGLPIADVAAHAYKAVRRRIGAGDYDRKAERDIQAASAELAEIAGWALYSEAKCDASRRFNQEALFLAKLCGDKSIELITLQNQALLSGWAGRPREELAIARAVLESERLTPRVEAIFRGREAQGLARMGQESEAARVIERARSLLQEAAPEDAPHWAWWITEREMDRQEGRALHDSGQFRKAIPILERAMVDTPGAHVGYRNVAAVRLLDCLLKERSWKAAEDAALILVPTVGDMSSIVSLKLLTAIARKGAELPGAPMGVRDALHTLSGALDADPYAL